MTTVAASPTPTRSRSPFLTTGWCLLALTVVSMPSAILLEGDPNRTTQVLIAIGFLVVAALDVVVGLGLGCLTSSARALSWAAALTRIAYAVVLAAAASGLLMSADFGAAGFQRWWHAGLLVFGVHLVVTAWAMGASRLGPWWLWIVLALAGVAYVLDAPELRGVVPSVVLMPLMFGELVLLGWRLWAGHRRSEPQASSIRPAVRSA